MGTAVMRALACALLSLISGKCAVLGRQCTPNGCCFFPNQHNAKSMECDLNGKEMTISNDDISPALQTIRIARASSLIVHEDAMANKDYLENIELSNLRRLTLRTKALYGLKNPYAEISISNVTACFVSSSAFPANSTLQRVSMENVRELTIESGGIQSAIGVLAITNTSMRVCERDTFKGRIGHLQLVSISLWFMHSGCVRAEMVWQSLTLKSSHLLHIQPSGIQGTIKEVIIENSHFGTVSPGGLNVTVSSLVVRGCEILRLRELALDVVADRDISLQNSTMYRLDTNAFHRLRVTAGQVSLSDLFVKDIRKGSLAFADGVAVVTRRIVTSVSCNCDTHGTVRQLVMPPLAAQTTNLTTDKHDALLQEIYRNTHCKHDGSEPTLAEFQCRQCANSSGPESWCSVPEKSDGRTEGTPHWVPYASLAGALLLLCFVFSAAMLLITRRRKSARQRSKGDFGPNAGVAISSDGDEHDTTPPRVEQQGGSIRPTSDRQGDPTTETATQHGEDVYMEMTPRPGFRLDTGSHIYQVIEEVTARQLQRTIRHVSTPLSQHQYGNSHASFVSDMSSATNFQAGVAAQSPGHVNVPYGGSSDAPPLVERTADAPMDEGAVVLGGWRVIGYMPRTDIS